MSQALFYTNYKGYFTNEAALLAAIPDGVQGDWAIVQATNAIYIWNELDQEWVGTSGPSVTSFRGQYDASTNLFPSTGGSGAGGSIQSGDFWVVSVAGTLGGEPVNVGTLLFALIDSPGQTASNWVTVNQNFVVGPDSATDNAVAAFDSTTGKLLQNSGITLSGVSLDTINGADAIFSGDVRANGSVTFGNGAALRTTNTLANTAVIQGYDNDDATYRTFATLTNGNTPSLAIAKPTGSALSIDGATIGANEAAPATVTTLSQSGNQTFSATGQRVAADFSNATRASRLNFQTSTTDGNTGVGAIPNGTATTSAFLTYGGSDPDNAAYAQFHATDSSHVGINSSKTGTGVTQPIDFQIDNVSAVRVQTDGNLAPLNDVVIANGKAIKTNTTSGNTATLQAYDNDNATYRTFATLTNGNTPSLAISAPSGGSATIDNTTIGGTTPAAITGTTITAADPTTPSITTASGKTNTGYLQVSGKTSGALRLSTADATAQTLTLSAAAQTVGDATITVPDVAGVNDTVALATLAQTLSNKTLASPTISGGTVTLSTDTNFVTSGGVNGFSVDTDTLSVDGTNNRVGILTTAPIAPLSMGGSTAGRQISVRDYSLSNDHQYEGFGRDTNQLIYQLSGSAVDNVWRRGDSSSASTELMRLDGDGAFKLSTYGAGFLQTDASGNVTATAFRSVVTSTVAVGSATSLTTDTPKTITSISVPAGTWQIFGNIGFIAASGTIFGSILGGVSQTNNTLPTPPAGGYSRLDIQFPAGPRTQDLVIGSSVVTLGSTTTIYLVAAAGFTVSTATAYGSITAVPVISS